MQNISLASRKDEPTVTTVAHTLKTTEMIRIIVTLVAFYLVVGSMIAIVNGYTQPIIERHAEEKRQKAASSASLMTQFKKVFPETESFEEIGKWTINEKTAPYYAIKKGDETIGHAIISYGKGYQSLIETLVGVDINFTVTGITVLSQAETPGLGEGVMTDDFQKQFKGRELSKLAVTTSGDANLVQALAGATISSRAVTDDAVKKAVEFLKSNIKQ